MKILHVSNHFYPCVGGIEKHIYDLCKNLIKLGHQSDVICLDRCAYSRKKLSSFEEYEKIKIYRIPFLDLKFYNIAPSILKFIKNYDIIHVHGLGFFSDFLAATKPLHKKSLMLSTHGGIFHTKTAFYLKFFYFHILERFLLGNFNKIIAISKQDKRLFSRIIKKITFVPDGIDYDKYSKIKRKPKKDVLIYVGRISKNKRIDRLIDVVYYLKEIDSNIKLYIIGEDWEGLLSNLKRIVKNKNLAKNVIFLGILEDRKLLDLLKRAQFFVSASEHEGFGISVIEAMSAGCPVVVNDISAFHNFIRNGKDGFITDYSNPREVANLILKLRNKNLSAVSREAKRTGKKYDWFNIIKSIERLYVNV